jgi:hypothetical protein
METDPVSEKLCFLFVEIRTMDKVQKLNSNEHNCEDNYTFNQTTDFMNKHVVRAYNAYLHQTYHKEHKEEDPSYDG